MSNIIQAELKGRRARSGHTLFLPLGLALLTAVGSLGCNSSSRTSNDIGKGSQASQIKAVLHLEAFVVNLADPGENRFLRVGMDLGLERPLPAKAGKGGEGEVPTARIRDCILEVLSTWHSDALLAPEGKHSVKWKTFPISAAVSPFAPASAMAKAVEMLSGEKNRLPGSPRSSA